MSLIGKRMRNALISYLNGIRSEEIDIRSVRNILGLTQERFAQELHTSVATVRRWEKRKAKPSQLARESMKRLLKERGLI